jgi:hypothetical protein
MTIQSEVKADARNTWAPMARPPAGLCDTCAHQRVIRNTRGSSFSLCERSRTDPAYPRYPRLPVVECPGWEQRPPGETE